MSSYKTVSGTAESVIVIERSKFICSVKGVNDEDDAKEFINLIRKKYSIANHNCYAYIADETGALQKFSDAGEPQGTAGLPILNALKNRDLKKVCAVVTRYFGGIKLGTGGLARAYGGVTVSAIDNAEIVELFQAEFLSLDLDYSAYKKFSALSVKEFAVRSVDYGERVTVNIAVKKYEVGTEKVLSKLKELLNGEVNATPCGSGYFAFLSE